MSDEEYAAVALALDILQETIRKYELFANGQHLAATVLTEQYLPIDDLDNGGWEGTTGGFADKVILDPHWRRGKVLDWKFGKFAVEPAVNNTQGIAYALGLVEYVRRRKGWILDEVSVEFVSPHIEERSEHTFYKADFEGLYTRLRLIVERALLGTKQADAGDFSLARPNTSGCMFCGRLATCTKAAETFISISKKYDPLETPEVDVRGLATPDARTARNLILLAGIGAKWASETRKRITERALLEGGIVPEGFRLQATYPRKVLNAREFFDFVKRILDGKETEDSLWTLLDLPLTPVEDLIKKHAPRGQKEAAVDAFSDQAIEAGLVKRSTSPTVSLRMKGKTDDK
jgi:hypothetical protein